MFVRFLADLLVAIDSGGEVAAAGLAAAGLAAAALRRGWRANPARQGEVVANPFPAVFCEDWHVPMRNYAEYAAHLAVQRAIAPDLRYSTLAFSATVGCLGWPSGVNNPQHRLRVRGAQPLLMLNSLHDPATGYNWALHAAVQLGDAARLVTYEGWGHGVYIRSTCTRTIVHDYLFTQVVPARGTRCPAEPVEEAGERAGPVWPVPAAPGW
jgi:hypothetical protein